jgi:hypothetical protein
MLMHLRSLLQQEVGGNGVGEAIGRGRKDHLFSALPVIHLSQEAPLLQESIGAKAEKALAFIAGVSEGGDSSQWAAMACHLEWAAGLSPPGS